MIVVYIPCERTNGITTVNGVPLNLGNFQVLILLIVQLSIFVPRWAEVAMATLLTEPVGLISICTSMRPLSLSFARELSAMHIPIDALLLCSTS